MDQSTSVTIVYVCCIMWYVQYYALMEFTTCAFNRYFGNSLHNFWYSSVMMLYPSGHVIHYMSVWLIVCMCVHVWWTEHTAVRAKVERENQRYCQIDFDAYNSVLINLTYSLVHTCSVWQVYFTGPSFMRGFGPWTSVLVFIQYCEVSSLAEPWNWYLFDIRTNSND